MNIILLGLILTFLNNLCQSQFASYNPSTIFHASYHSLAQLEIGSHVVTLTAPVAQVNIVRAGLSVAGLTKYPNYNVRFNAILSSPPLTTTLFTVSISIDNSSGLKLENSAPTLINNNFAANRSQPMSVDIRTITMFNTTAGCLFYPFLTYYKTLINLNSTGNQTFFAQSLTIGVINTTHINTVLSVNPYSQVYEYGFMILIINQAMIDYAAIYNIIYSHSKKDFWIGQANQTSFVILAQQPLFGPIVQYKCFLGETSMRWWRVTDAQYAITVDGSGYYQQYSELKGSQSTNSFVSNFCFGQELVCLSGTIPDLIDKKCYLPPLCPYPVPASWSIPVNCPKCFDLICFYCKVDRFNCVQCVNATNSTFDVTSQRCLCWIGYYKIFYNLSLDNVLWGGKSLSHQTCWMNCTYWIPNCKLNDCINQTVCTICKTNYFPRVINQTHTDCLICSSWVTNCDTCYNTTSCQTCITGYFVYPIYNPDGSLNQIACTLCQVVVSFCINCLPGPTCGLCMTGYGIDTSVQCTNCSTLLSSACLQCTNYFTCTKCISGSILYNGTCNFCQLEIANCLSCAQNSTGTGLECLVCQDQYYLKTNTYCQRCIFPLNNCFSCLSASVCTQCEYPYILDSNKKCTKCQRGYNKINGYCTKQKGCKNMLYTPYSTWLTNDVCIECLTEANWIYNQNKQQCECNYGYSQMNITLNNFITVTCVQLCGDGIYKQLTQECDDGNRLSNDGCSAYCKVQKDFKCQNILLQTIKCILYYNFTKFTYNYAYRNYGQYTGYLSFSIYPPHIGLSRLNWADIVTINISSSHINHVKYTYNSNTGQLLASFKYQKDLQFQDFLVNLLFDIDYVNSYQNQFNLTAKINGINAPLILEGDWFLEMSQYIQIAFMVLVILYWIQFMIASLFHKMIGLQTIQVLQTFYFSRIFLQKQNSSLLISSNMLKNSNGISNIDSFGNPNNIGSDYGFIKFMTVNHQLIEINLQKFYLMNVNWLFIPIVLFTFIYILLLIFRLINKQRFIRENKVQFKEYYALLSDKIEIIYDRFLFPYIMSLLFITFFSCLEAFTGSQLLMEFVKQFNYFIYMSFFIHILMISSMAILICVQIRHSYFSYFHPVPKAVILDFQNAAQRLQDARRKKLQKYQPTMHQIYILGYFVYQLIFISLLMLEATIPNFHYLIYLLVSVATLYLVILIKWNPYIQNGDGHNKFIKFNQFTIIGFLIQCEVLTRIQRLQNNNYIFIMFGVIGMLLLVLIGGYLRIIVHFRNKKEEKTQIDQNQQNYQEDQNGNLILKTKKTDLFLKNMFIFDNQLLQFQEKYGGVNKDNVVKGVLTQEDKNFLINKIRQENVKRYQNIQFLDQFKEKDNSVDQMINSIKQLIAQQQIIQQNKKKVPIINRKLVDQYPIDMQDNKQENKIKDKKLQKKQKNKRKIKQKQKNTNKQKQKQKSQNKNQNDYIKQKQKIIENNKKQYNQTNQTKKNSLKDIKTQNQQKMIKKQLNQKQQLKKRLKLSLLRQKAPSEFDQ